MLSPLSSCKLHKRYSNLVSSGFSGPELTTLSSVTYCRKVLGVSILLFLPTTPPRDNLHILRPVGDVGNLFLHASHGTLLLHSVHGNNPKRKSVVRGGPETKGWLNRFAASNAARSSHFLLVFLFCLTSYQSERSAWG